MDQDAYHRTYREINDRYCPFERSILNDKCSCGESKRFYLAERIGVHCESDQGQAQCMELLELLRHHARFALKSNDRNATLPHGQAMRLQVGGVRGLFSEIYPQEPIPEPVGDIFTLVNSAIEKFNSLDELPFQPIIQQVAAYRGRQRSKPNK